MRPVIVIALVLTVSACKQGEGEVCQVDADCEDVLVCNQLTKQCQRLGDDNTDANFTPDARQDGHGDGATSTDGAPADSTPADSMPADSGPADSTSGDGTPVDAPAT